MSALKKLNFIAFEKRLQLIGIIFSLACLTTIALANTLEYYDGIEYLVSSLTYLGFPWTINPKNTFMIYLGSLMAAPLVALKIQPSLPYFHFIVLLLNLALIPFLVVTAQKLFKEPTGKIITLLALSTPLFLHYATFMLPDLLCAMLIGIWIFLESLTIHRLSKYCALGLVLAMIAMNRPHALAIPAIYYLLLSIAAPKQLYRLFIVAIICAVVFVFAFASMHAAISSTDLFSGFQSGINILRGYAKDVDAQYVIPAYAYGIFFVKGFGIIGAAIAVYGLFLAYKDRIRDFFLLRLSLALFGFYLILILVAHKEARYLLPGLPIILLLQTRAFMEVRLLLPKIAGVLLTILLIAGSLPTLLHFRDPVYRADLPKKISQNIASWSKSDSASFLFPGATFHPKDAVFSKHDNFFYMFHYSAHSLAFHSGLKTRQVKTTFVKYGYPIPDDMAETFPENHTLVAPTDKFMNTKNFETAFLPIEALRWRKNSKELGREGCLAEPKEICVERIVVFPGLTWN